MSVLQKDTIGASLFLNKLLLRGYLVKWKRLWNTCTKEIEIKAIKLNTANQTLSLRLTNNNWILTATINRQKISSQGINSRMISLNFWCRIEILDTAKNKNEANSNDTKSVNTTLSYRVI